MSPVRDCRKPTPMRWALSAERPGGGPVSAGQCSHCRSGKSGQREQLANSKWQLAGIVSSSFAPLEVFAEADKTGVGEHVVAAQGLQLHAGDLGSGAKPLRVAQGERVEHRGAGGLPAMPDIAQLVLIENIGAFDLSDTADGDCGVAHGNASGRGGASGAAKVHAANNRRGGIGKDDVPGLIVRRGHVAIEYPHGDVSRSVAGDSAAAKDVILAYDVPRLVSEGHCVAAGRAGGEE